MMMSGRLPLFRDGSECKTAPPPCKMADDGDVDEAAMLWLRRGCDGRSRATAQPPHECADWAFADCSSADAPSARPQAARD